MKATVEIDDELMALARREAQVRRLPLERVLSQALRDGLKVEAGSHPTRELPADPSMWTFLNGFPQLPPLPSGSISNDDVNRIREEEGI